MNSNQQLKIERNLHEGQKNKLDRKSDHFFNDYQGCVFVLNLTPFFNLVGATPDSRIGEGIVTFAETVLSRDLANIGIFKKFNDQQFFFRLKKSDAEGWGIAARFANEIGLHFFRDSYRPEKMFSQTLASVDARYLINKNGHFDGDRALANLTTVNSIEDALQKSESALLQTLDVSDDDIDTNSDARINAEQTQAALELVGRKPDRRRNNVASPSFLERRSTTGRRNSDIPNASLWYQTPIY